MTDIYFQLHHGKGTYKICCPHCRKKSFIEIDNTYGDADDLFIKTKKKVKG